MHWFQNNPHSSWSRDSQEIQFRIDEIVGPQLSSTVSFEAFDKSLFLGEWRQLLLPDANFHLEYRNGLHPAEAYASDFVVDHRYLFFCHDPQFEAAERKGVGNGSKNISNLFGPKRFSSKHVPLIYFGFKWQNFKTQSQRRRISKFDAWHGGQTKFGTLYALLNACCRRSLVTFSATDVSTSTRTSHMMNLPLRKRANPIVAKQRRLRRAVEGLCKLRRRVRQGRRVRW